MLLFSMLTQSVFECCTQAFKFRVIQSEFPPPIIAIRIAYTQSRSGPSWTRYFHLAANAHSVDVDLHSDTPVRCNTVV